LKDKDQKGWQESDMEVKGRISRVNNSKEEKSLFDRHLFRASAYQTVAQIKTTQRLKELIQ